MAGRIPYCCAAAEFDGFTPEEHAPFCREPRSTSEPAETGDGGLFPAPDQTHEGGAHL